MSEEGGNGGESPQPEKPGPTVTTAAPTPPPPRAAAAASPLALDLDDESAAELAERLPRMRQVASEHRRVARWGIWAVGAVGIVVGAVVLGQFAYYRFTMSMTNDAFLESHIVHLAFQESGVVARVHVEERDAVKAGQILAEIDMVPLTRVVDEAVARRRAAEAMLEYEKATLERLVQEHPRRVAVAQKEEASAEAAVAEAEALLKMTTIDVDKAVNEAKADTAALLAALVNAKEEHDRESALFAREATTERRLQDATRVLRAAQAKVDAGQAKVERAEADRAQVEIARRALDQRLRAKEKAEESVRLAELGDLEIEVQKRQVLLRAEEVAEAERAEATAKTRRQNARIVAPFDGVVVRRYRNPGDHAPLGSPVLSMYDPELVYVTAYLEEDRLEGVAPGNDVSIWADAFPDKLRGRVVWIGQATGANFSLLPRDVTAGEFTKVTQRVPVRIAVERGPRWGQLRPGLSVTVAISHVPGDVEWARQEAERQRTRGELGVSPTSIPETAAEVAAPRSTPEEARP
ncbi:HlyD family secretion protein [Planctomyces sp. SH-PL62]|uniref:HlyD family secretion protein n=1 Tax=Planctomyces sp. SH-PL62 TaxID=1636152 RepID=UPI00078EF057|nr:HlyD family efflux transporter periplasmic adaptor subunit [Planctomyces sp. SH-PL62]AMV38156.1 Multidrug export protein EmrA [Planctomyces sp. SH-PL62]